MSSRRRRVSEARIGIMAFVAFGASATIATWLTWERAPLFRTSIALAIVGFGASVVLQRLAVRPMVAMGVRAVALFLTATGLSHFCYLVDLGAALSLGLLTAATLTAITMLPVPILSIGLLPLWAAGYLRVALSWTHDDVTRNLVALGVVAVIVIACRLRSYLTVDGTFAAWLVGYLTWGLGSARWFVPLLAIFLAVNWAGKGVKKLLGREAPDERDDIEEKGSERDHVQVFANVGVGVVILLVTLGAPGLGSSCLFGAYLGSLAAACADTLASEIGILSRSRPVLLWTFRPVPPGQSGGVSALGYAGAALGALVPALALALVDGSAGWSPRLFLGALACGLAGSTVDSIVGATLQGKRRCVICERTLERGDHCGAPTTAVSGLPFVTNDLVNVIGALTGAITGALVLCL